MKLIPYSALFNLFIAAISGSEDTEANRYIIIHENDIDPFSGIADISALEHTHLLNDGAKSWTIATLTYEEAQIVNNTIQNSGTIVLDTEIQLPSDITEIDDPEIDNTETAGTNSIYLNDYPECNSTVDNVDIFVIDTTINAQAPQFAGIDVKNIKSYTNPENPDAFCHPHGTEVASVITGNNIGTIRGGNRTIRGIGIFNCNSKGYASSIISAFNDLIQYQKTLDQIAKNGGVKRRAIGNISGGGGQNPAVDAAALAVYNAGIPIFAAAGNNGNDACSFQSPARADGVFAAGGTTFPGDLPSWFTNYGARCVDAYFPSDPVSSKSTDGSNVKSIGSSFASPIVCAQGAMELGLDLSATPAQVYSRIMQRTVTVKLEDSVVGDQINVMTKNAACFTKTILNLYTTTKNDNNKFNTWQNTLLADNNKLCVRVNVKLQAKDGWVSIGLRQNSTSTDVTKVIIGDFIGNKKARHTIQQNGVTKATAVTKNNRIVSRKLPTTLQIENSNNSLLVQYNTAVGLKTLLTMQDSTSYNEISFSTGGKGKVTYFNALKC